MHPNRNIFSFSQASNSRQHTCYGGNEFRTTGVLRLYAQNDKLKLIIKNQICKCWKEVVKMPT